VIDVSQFERADEGIQEHNRKNIERDEETSSVRTHCLNVSLVSWEAPIIVRICITVFDSTYQLTGTGTIRESTFYLRTDG